MKYFCIALFFYREQAAARNVHLPSKPLELLILRHRIRIDKRNGLDAVEVENGAGHILEIFALAEYLIKKRFAEYNHHFRIHKGEFLGKHFAERRKENRREWARQILKEIGDAQTVGADVQTFKKTDEHGAGRGLEKVSNLARLGGRKQQQQLILHPYA